MSAIHLTMEKGKGGCFGATLDRDKGGFGLRLWLGKHFYNIKFY